MCGRTMDYKKGKRYRHGRRAVVAADRMDMIVIGIAMPIYAPRMNNNIVVIVAYMEVPRTC